LPVGETLAWPMASPNRRNRGRAGLTSLAMKTYGLAV
jgi:hypothetical protein